MPDSVILWPYSVLKPAQIMADPVPFTRSGGRSLGGISRNTRTDRGYWKIDYKGVALTGTARRRLWNSIRTGAGGMAGLLAVPVWSQDSAPWPAGASDGRFLTSHSDGSPFSDGSRYAQSAFSVQMAVAAAIGDTSVTLRAVWNIDELAGIRFSYEHALYETGLPTLIDDDEWTLPVFPAIRAVIPIDAELEVGMPTCLVHLANDRAMDAVLSAAAFDRVDVGFVEAADVWSDLAAS